MPGLATGKTPRSSTTALAGAAGGAAVGVFNPGRARGACGSLGFGGALFFKPPVFVLPGDGLLYKFLSKSGARPAGAVDAFSVVALYKSSFLNCLDKVLTSVLENLLARKLTYSNIYKSFCSQLRTRNDKWKSSGRRPWNLHKWSQNERRTSSDGKAGDIIKVKLKGHSTQCRTYLAAKFHWRIETVNLLFTIEANVFFSGHWIKERIMREVEAIEIKQWIKTLKQELILSFLTHSALGVNLDPKHNRFGGFQSKVFSFRLLF